MFLIRDSVESRHAKIIKFLSEGEASISLLLAVIDLERTLRRTILALGSTPTKELGQRLGNRSPNKDPGKGPIGYRSSLEGLNDAWKKEVQPRLKRKLPNDLARDWDTVRKAFNLRNRLVHGAQGPTKKDFAEKRIKAVLALTRELHVIASKEGHNLYKPVRRRLKERVS
jgi:hypothetical protein